MRHRGRGPREERDVGHPDRAADGHLREESQPQAGGDFGVHRREEVREVIQRDGVQGSWEEVPDKDNVCSVKSGPDRPLQYAVHVHNEQHNCKPKAGGERPRASVHVRPG